MMNKQELIDSAGSLTTPSSEAATIYDVKRDILATQVTEELKSREDLDRLIGQGNTRMMEDNHRNHALYMASVFKLFIPEQFVETIIWVYRAYLSHGFYLAYWPAQLNAWLDAMDRELPAAQAGELRPFYEWLIIHQADFVALSEKETSIWENPPAHS
ncbi:MAG: hypothetical protein ACOCWR_09855 [Oceanidesulfovibrio sp.]